MYTIYTVHIYLHITYNNRTIKLNKLHQHKTSTCKTAHKGTIIPVFYRVLTPQNMKDSVCEVSELSLRIELEGCDVISSVRTKSLILTTYLKWMTSLGSTDCDKIEQL